jgi:hypothetical protein
MRGRQQIEERFGEALASFEVDEFSNLTVECEEHGDVAYELGHFTQRAFGKFDQTRSNGTPQVLSDLPARGTPCTLEVSRKERQPDGGALVRKARTRRARMATCSLLSHW